MMVTVQDRLGHDFGSKISFVSITVDPERDTPEDLKMYAQAYGANLAGWTFLTGEPEAIRDVTRRVATGFEAIQKTLVCRRALSAR